MTQEPDIRGRRPRYFADPVTDRLASVVAELAAQVWVLKDRQRILELRLVSRGQIEPAEVDMYEPSEEEQKALREERDRFLERVFRELAQTEVLPNL